MTDMATPTLVGDFLYHKTGRSSIKELIGITNKYTKVVELWLDACWEKKRERWPIAKIYKTVKEMAPQCQVGVNWSIGLHVSISRFVSTTEISYKKNAVNEEIN